MRTRWLIGIGLAVAAALGGLGQIPLRAAEAKNAFAARAQAPLAQNMPSPSLGEPCVFVDGGTVEGNMTYNGGPAPDGTYVVLIAPGITETAVAQDGHYALPMLARACSDGIYWMPFSLRPAGDEHGYYSPGVSPNAWDMHVDLETPNPITAASFQSPYNPPSVCTLALGTLSGAVLVDGASAPDGTAVTAVPALANTTALVQQNTQTVLTSGGRYMLTTVGTRCEDQPIQFTQLVVTVLGTSVTVTATPDQETASQDIEVSSQAGAGQGQAAVGP